MKDFLDNPLRIRVLGENLVLFRDGSRKPGLVIEMVERGLEAGTYTR